MADADAELPTRVQTTAESRADMLDLKARQRHNCMERKVVSEEDVGEGARFWDCLWAALWTWLHAVSFQYPEQDPDPEVREAFKAFYMRVGANLPVCQTCKADYEKAIAAHPDFDSVFDSRDALTRWFVELHNGVNDRIRELNPALTSKQPNAEYEIVRERHMADGGRGYLDWLMTDYEVDLAAQLAAGLPEGTLKGTFKLIGDALEHVYAANQPLRERGSLVLLGHVSDPTQPAFILPTADNREL